MVIPPVRICRIWNEACQTPLLYSEQLPKPMTMRQKSTGDPFFQKASHISKCHRDFRTLAGLALQVNACLVDLRHVLDDSQA